MKSSFRRYKKYGNRRLIDNAQRFERIQRVELVKMGTRFDLRRGVELVRLPPVGADEQSQLLFLRPESVPADYRSAPSLTGANFADLVRIAKAEGCAGLLRRAATRHCRYGGAGIRAFLAKRKCHCTAKKEGKGRAFESWSGALDSSAD